MHENQQLGIAPEFNVSQPSTHEASQPELEMELQQCSNQELPQVQDEAHEQSSNTSQIDIEPNQTD